MPFILCQFILVSLAIAAPRDWRRWTLRLLLQRVAPWPSLSRRFVFVVSVDRGRCFQDDAVDRFRDATVLMYEGTASYPRSPSKPQLSFPCYNRHTDIVIPPVTDLGGRTRLAYSLPELNAVAHAAKHANASFPWSFFTHRKILAAWRGSATRTAWASKGGEDNNVDVRQALLHAFGKANHSTILAVRAARKDSSSSHLQHAPASQLPILISTRKLDKAQHYAELRNSALLLSALWLGAMDHTILRGDPSRLHTRHILPITKPVAARHAV